MLRSTILVFLLISSYLPSTFSRPSEQERVEQWHNAGNTWPPKWQEETEAMKIDKANKEREVMALTGANERWENWLQLTQSRLVPKFTERGFEVINTPKHIHEKLLKATMDGVNRWDELRSEGKVDVIYLGREKKLPKFVDLGPLAWEVINDPVMKELHEQWAGGMELQSTSAYGVRLYQNGSSLVMHYDRVQTHVISSIVHIAHQYDDDNNPWPIQIEDHNGDLHSVNLEPGQMLFYESAKCLHGRVKEFRGTYYGSIFLHYAPVDKNIWDYDVEKVIANVPPHWRKGVKEEKGVRWAGACMTIDSRVADGAPYRKPVVFDPPLTPKPNADSSYRSEL